MRHLVRIAAVAACAAACSGGSATHSDPLTAGPGIKIDPTTQSIAIDDSKVPMMPVCAAGQLVRRGASGWECSASAPDSAQLGGKPAAAYLTNDSSAANASNLEGHPASFFLAATAQAADSAQLGGIAASGYLTTSGVAADSAKLGGKDASFYQPAAIPAANAMALNGHPDTFFLPAGGKAEDSFALGGLPAKSYLTTSGTAANSLKLGNVDASAYVTSTTGIANDAKSLGGQLPAKYVRADLAASLTGPVTIAGTGGVVASVDAKGALSAAGPISTNNSISAAGSVTAAKDVTAKGTVFTTNLHADGNATVVGDVAAGSFNGLQLFPKAGNNVTCDALCIEAGGTCVAAKFALTLPGNPLKASRCDATFIGVPFNVACQCAAFQ